ncbi:MAG TPA: threonine ammonia-lyase IlvA [Marmoricola sp.]|nr:threonine ammonia-lyase IlvA [Marmoricola sp.]
MPPLSAADVERAAVGLAAVVRRTPLERSARLSAATGAEVHLKREDLQPVRSYKVRGAHHLISSLSAAERRRGVVCASAGNHGQGVAASCAALGIDARVYVPANTPRQKRQRILALGRGRVELVVTGSRYDEASAAALADAETSGAVYVHPFDDPRTILGQGTVAPELAEQAGPDLHTVVVPLGGGGLAAGTAVWLRERRPRVRIVGVEPAGAPSMTAALAAGEPVDLAEVDSFVDGAAVGRVGRLTFPLVRDLVDDVVTVSEGAVSTEMLALYQVDGIIAEPAGALATTALPQLAVPAAARVVCVVSGGNNDVSRYSEILERSLIHEGLRHYFLVTFPQEPGALRHFLDDVLSEGEDIVVFEYVKKNNRETGPALVGIELEAAGDLGGLLQRMADSRLHIERVPPGSPVFAFLT